MKRILKLAVFGIAAIAALSSCSKNEDVPSQKEIETKIIGKWKSITQERKETPTNNRFIETYEIGGKGFQSSCNAHPVTHELGWINKGVFTYTISDGYVTVKDNIERVPEGGPINDGSMPAPEQMEKKQQVLSIDNNSMLVSRLDGKVLIDLKKVTADFSNDIIGLWEGVEMTGYETYGNAEARIEYKADGTYTYYKKEGDYWVHSTNVDNEYNVDGDWLATRWRSEFGADFFYEWWDIESVTDTQMKWSALREKEDGTFFNTTFTWKKVKEAYPERLSSTWEYSNGSTGYRASLLIEELDGGQYGRFELVTPSHDGDFSLEGAFSYDATTGVGYVSNGMIGGYTVYVQASTATDREIDISVSRILSGERDILFEGTFSAK